MQTFFNDFKDRKVFYTKLTGMTVAALALGMVFPFIFSFIADRAPLLAPILKVEGTELGGTVILLPAGMFFLTLSCVILEALLLGYENSTLKGFWLTIRPQCEQISCICCSGFRG
jgi:hypothetical protein